MGDAEQVQMDSTPIFPPVKSAPSTVTRRRKVAPGGEGEGVEEKGEPQAKGLPKYLRVLLLLSLIPIMFYVPKVLVLAGDKVQKNQHLLIYLWTVSTLFFTLTLTLTPFT
jgi:hypothetical protein